MNSRIALLLLAPAFLTASTCDGDTGDGQTIDRLTIRLSVSVNLTQALGHSTLNTITYGIAPGQVVSSDGRFVVFESEAANLTDGDPNTFKDIYVKDRLTGGVERVSVKTINPNVPGTVVADALTPSISADGRYVVWVSAGDYASGVGADLSLWIHDRQLRQTLPVLDFFPGEDCLNPAVAVDAGGRVLVAFVSTEEIVGSYDYSAGTFKKVWVADLSTSPPTYTLASANNNVAADGDSGNPHFSADGSCLTFMTSATNLNADDTNGQDDVYIVDPDGGPPGGLPTDEPDLVSRRDDTDAVIDFGGVFAWPSADGRYVAFMTSGDIGTGLGAFGGSQVVRRDRQLGVTALMSRTQAGVPGDSGSGFPSISDDGQTLAFLSNSGNLVPQVVSAGNQVAVRLPDGSFIHGSADPSGLPSEFISRPPVISGNGRWVVWHGPSTHLVPGDTNFSDDVFAHGPLQ